MDASIKDKLIDLVKTRLENEDWVATVENVDEEPKQLKVITTDKFIIVVEIDEDGTVNIIEEGPDDGEPYPSLTLTQLPLEGIENEKIEIKAEAEVVKTSKTKKVTTVRIVKPESKKQEKEYTEGGVIFEVTENEVYTIEAETNMGKTRRKTIEINITKPESDIEITSEPTTPRNTVETGTQNGIAKGPIHVSIKYGENSYVKQYKKETDENWTTVTGSTADFTVTENIAIFAKYSDGTNSFKTVTYNIQNVDNVVPNAFSVTETHTTNSITVGASTTDTASTGASSTIAGILRYEYRIYKNGSWQGWQTAKTFTGLTTGTYKVQAKAIDKAGNERVSSELANITLGTVSTEDIKVSSSPTTPRNTKETGTQNGVAKGPITVSITYGNSSYTRQYKKGTDTEWTPVTGTTANFTVTENVAIFARYFDGTNGFQTQAYNIQNVDNVAPNSFNVAETHTTNSITVGASTTDTASEGASSTIAGILKYEYRIYKNSAWEEWQSSNTFAGLTTGTYKVQAKAIDKAGNETLSNEKQIETGEVTSAENGAIVFENLNWSSGKANVTIRKTTSDSLKIRYRVLNSNGTEKTSYQEISSGGIVSNLNLGEIVVAQLHDGVNGGKTTSLNIQDKTSPKVTVSKGTITTNSIGVSVIAVDNEAGMSSTPSYKYYIKKSSENAYSLITTKNNASYTYTGLEQHTSYDFKVETTDIAGNTGRGELKNITTGTVTGLTEANTWFTYSTTEWTNGNIVATAHTNVTGYTLQTSKSPTTGYSNTASQTFEENGTIYARVVDSSGQASGYATGNITKIDKSIPTFTGAEVKNVSESGYDVYIYGVSDIGSGVNRVQFPTWTLNNDQDDIIWGNGTNQGNGTWYYRVNISDHNYEIGQYVTHIYIWDNVGNTNSKYLDIQNISGYTISYNANGGSGAPASQTKAYGANLTLSSTVPTRSGYTFLGWSTSSTATTATYAKGATYTANMTATLYAVWKIDNVAPTSPTTSVTSRNTNTIIVNAKSTDSNGDKLTYKLYTKSASASGYTLSATSASTASGTAVNLTASGLSSYTVYTYYVTVSDGKAAEQQSSVKTTGTACDYTVAVSHTASYCTDGYVEVTYHTCNGSGCWCGCTSTINNPHQHGRGNPHNCKHGIPDKHYYCDTHNITNLGSNSTCPGYITCTNSSCSGKKTLTCTNTTKVETTCGGTLSVTGSSSDQGHTVNFTWKCSVCGTIPSLGTPNATYHDGVAHNKTITVYKCSTHGYSGSSSSHKYTTGCDHGYTSSHYYCNTHGYVGTEKTHKACGHGYIKMHYPN